MSQNHTAQDAFLRVQNSRLGSLVSPTSEYLEALRNQLYVWLREVEVEIEVEAMNAAEAAAIDALTDEERDELSDDCGEGLSPDPDRERFHSDG